MIPCAISSLRLLLKAKSVFVKVNASANASVIFFFFGCVTFRINCSLAGARSCGLQVAGALYLIEWV